MSEKTCNCNCAEKRKEQFKDLQPVLDQYANVKGSLITILQKAQDIYGYLSVDTINYISDATGIKPAKIYGVATFYAQFTMSPKGKYQVSVCLGTACYVKGSGNVLDKVEQVLGIKDGECTPDGVFSIETCRCVGACGLAPVMIVGGDVYGKIVPDDVPGILAKYK